MHKPESFNEVFTQAFHEVVGSRELTTELLSSIISDCVNSNELFKRNSIENQAILQPHIFAALGGLTPSNMHVANAELIELEMRYNPALSDEESAHAAQCYNIRDNIHFVQQCNGISALVDRHLAIRDHLFCFKDYDSLLVPLESDREILKAQVPSVIEYFLKVSENYDLYEESENGELESFKVKGVRPKFKRVARDLADHAWLYPESKRWIREGNGKWRALAATKAEPDKINFCFEMWDNHANFRGIYSAVALHKDRSRFPI